MRIVIFLLTLFVFTACNDDKPAVKEVPANVETTPAVNEKYNISLMPESKSFDAEIEDMDFKNGVFNFVIESDEYKLGQQTPDADQMMCANSAKGQHIHLIVDNKPYAAKYTPTFKYDIEDGDHYIMAFLSRSYHESLKDDDAFKAVKATIKNNTIVEEDDIDEPMLFYSRPKGTYTGKKETERVMLDFYPVNVDLGDDHKIKADVNGQVFMINEWKPFFLTGLPMGKNTITLTLLDEDDNIVDTPLNPVTREFELVGDIPTK